MKRTLLTRILCLALTAAMLLGFLPPASASATVTWKETDQSVSPDLRSPITPSSAEDACYDPEENVRVSIVLEDKPTIQAGFSTRNIGQNTSAMAYNRSLRSQQTALAQAISTQVLGGKKLDVVWNLTLAANLISANVPYGKIEAISRMEGVKAVVRENSYTPCVAEQEDLAQPQMYTSLGMTGAGLTWATGFTGAGSRIAVIDTGTDILHQSLNNSAFLYALKQNAETAGVSYDKYLQKLDLLDKQEIASVLSLLNIKEKSPSLTADQLYHSEKHPFAVNYVDGEDRRLVTDHLSDNAGDHGSHVAGIAAANRFIPQGSSYANALSLVNMAGTAPDAQLITMKVFGYYSPYDSDFMAAVEDAIYLGCDAVNLSLGTSNPGSSFSEEFKDLLDYMTQTDTVVVASAGNSFSWPMATNYGYLYSDDVSMDTVGSPGSYGSFFTVASVENDLSTATSFQVLGSTIVYNDGSNAGNYPLTSLDTSADQTGTEYEYVFIDGLGEKADYGNVDLRGKVAICSRGNLNFAVKAANAADLGAAATIVYNNEPGLFGMDLLYYNRSNPCASISQEDADFIRNNSTRRTASNGTVYYTGKITFFGKGVPSLEVNSQQLMSDYSSWGVPGNLSLKPEITAPGGNIYSLAGMAGSHNQYQLMSGTSMAAPAVTGMAALMAQYLRQSGLAQQEGQLPRVLAQSLLMSTAVPLREADSGGNYYSLLKQGAGLARVDLAAAADSYILVNGQSDGKVKAELGDDPNRTGVYEFSFSINNLTDRALVYSLSADVFCQGAFEYSAGSGVYLLDTWTTPLPASASFTVGGVPVRPAEDLSAYDLNGDGTTNALDADFLLEYLLGNEDTLHRHADVSGDGEVNTYDAHVLLTKLSSTSGVNVPAGGSVTVKVKLSLTAAGKQQLEENFANGTYVEAFVYAQSQSSAEGLSGTCHSIPVLAFYGNWSDPNMFDHGTLTELSYAYEGNPPYFYPLYSQGVIGNTLAIDYGDGDEYIFGGNPYVEDAEYLPERNAFSTANGSSISSQYYNLIRNASQVQTVISNARTGEEYYRKSSGSVFSAYYNVNSGSWSDVQQVVGIGWRGTDAAGNPLAEGTPVDVTLTAVPEYYRNADGSHDLSGLGRGTQMTTSFTIDNTAPKASDIRQVNETTLRVTARDNRHVAAIALANATGSKILSIQSPNQTNPDVSVTVDLDLSGIIGKNFLVCVYDYAGNETTYTVSLELPELQRPYFTAIDCDTLDFVGVDKDGSVTYLIESGLHQPVQAAEYVGGHVFLITEDRTLWVTSDQDLGAVQKIRSLDADNVLGITGFTDMAYNPADRKLYAQFYSYLNYQETPYLCTIGMDDGTMDVLCALPEDVYTMAIDSQGNFYGVGYGSNQFYTYTLAGVTSANPRMTYLGTTGYYSASAPSSMAWDHATGKLYWAYPNTLLEIHPKTGEPTLLGYYRESLIGLFTRPAGNEGRFDPVNRVDWVYLNHTQARLLSGYTLHLEAAVFPWNASDRSVTWRSSNSSVASVDQAGVVTGHAAGTAVITASSSLDPGKTASCTVTVEAAGAKTLNAIIWDEAGEIWMSEFSTDDLSVFKKLHTASLSPSLASATVGQDGTIYAADLDLSTLQSALYRLDPNTYAPTLIGYSSYGYTDLAPAPGMPGNTLMGIYGSNLMLIDSTTGDYYDAYSMFSNHLVGIAYVGTEEYIDDIFNTMIDWYFLIDITGTVYLLGFLEQDGVFYYMENDALAPGGVYTRLNCKITTSFFCSAYFDGEFLYFSAYQESLNNVALMAIDVAGGTGSCYPLGTFPDGVWPVAGLMELGKKPMSHTLDLHTSQKPQAMTASEVPALPEGTIPEKVSAQTSQGGVHAHLPQNSGEFEQDSNRITVTLTPPRTETNGRITLYYNASQLKLAGISGATEAFAWTQGSGTVEIAYASANALGDNDAVATVTFEVLQPGEHRFTVFHMEAGNGHLGKEEYLTVVSDCDHSYKAVVTAPTCQSQGYTTHTCSRCGDSYVDTYVDPVPHNYDKNKTSCEWCGLKALANFTSYTCSLGGNISVNFYVNVTEELLNNPDAYVLYQYAGLTVKQPISAGQHQSGIEYKFSCPVNSKQMTVPITAQFFVGDTPVSRVLTKSVADYANYLVQNSKSEKVVNLMTAMLNYGAASQTYFKYRTDELANSQLSAEAKELGTVDATAFAHQKIGELQGIKLTGATLMLDSETTIRIYFQPEEGKSIEDFTFTVNGQKATPTLYKGEYYISMPNIGAHNLDETYVFACNDFEVHYSGRSYVNQLLKSYQSGPEYDLARALYRYSEAAENYLVN